MSDPVEILQERIGHRFADAAHLREALTHPSSRGSGADNERLEFLGDAVLQLAVTERLHAAFPAEPEGRLTPWRAALVSREAMARLAAGLDLGALLSMSVGEERSGGRERPSNLANAMEAVIGAVFRDGGWEAARAGVLRLLGPELARLEADPGGAPGFPRNAKGDLQELLQREGGAPPRYLCVREDGAAHDRIYEVAVEWRGAELGRGAGKSKQEAEVNAARTALAALKNRLS